MFFNYLQVFIPVICLSISVLTHVFIFRYNLKLGLLKSGCVSFVIGILSIFLFEYYIFFAGLTSRNDSIVFFTTNLTIFCLLQYCYFHFVNLGETARRIRILMELYDSKDGLSIEDLLQRYNSREIVEKRISRLVNKGQIIFKGGRYYIANKLMLFVAKGIVMMKLIILGKESEFS